MKTLNVKNKTLKLLDKTIDKISQTKCNTALRKTDPMQLHYSEELLFIKINHKKSENTDKAGREGSGEGSASRCAALHSSPRHMAVQQWKCG